MSDTDASILAKTARGAGWVVAWRMITRTLGLLSTLVLVRLLDPADFGLVALASSFATSIEAFSWIGVEEGVIRHQAPTPALLDTAFTISVLRGATIGLLIAAAAYPGAAFFGDPRLAPVVIALGVSAFLETLTNIGTVEFRRDFGFAREFRLWLLPRLLSIVLAISVAAVFHSYWALIAGSVANQVFRVLFSYTMHPYRPRLGLHAWRELVGYSLWSSAIEGIQVVRSRIDTILIGRVLNAASVGLYAVGYEIAELPVSELVSPLTRAAFPGFAAARRNQLELGQTWARLVAAAALLTVPAGIGMSAVAYPLIALAFGRGWQQAVPVVQVLGLAFCFSVFGTVGQTLFMAQGQLRTNAGIVLASLVVRVALLLALIPAYGLTGAALAAGIGIVMEQAVAAAVALHTLRLSPWTGLLPLLWRCLAAAACMAAALWASGLGWQDAPGPPALVAGKTVALGAASYLAVLAALWLARARPPGPETDILALLQRIRRPRPA